MERSTAKKPLFATDDVSWTCLFAGPVAWFLDQEVSYVLVPWSCDTGHLLPTHIVSLAALLLAITGGVLGWRDWSRRRRTSSEEGDADGRAHFLALTGMLMCALFGLVILVEGVAKFYFDPCQR
ncbi:MAG TPA: hypothetical protein VGD08_24265 [Stellaceae bacterium]|jgi:hypothetical protein